MKEMLNTLQVLEQLNRTSQNIIYTDKEIDEEKEDAIVEQLIKLHLIYRDFIWQYDLMNDMIKKIIRLYR